MKLLPKATSSAELDGSQVIEGNFLFSGIWWCLWWAQTQDFQSLSKLCNPSQMAAVRMGLENKIGLIQGPPGTGKSYVGAILARILMANTDKPIIVVCFTNHALDTFLESLMKHTGKIVRIGGRSKSLKLEPFTLASIKKHLKQSMARNSQIYKAIKALEAELRNPDLSANQYNR